LSFLDLNSNNLISKVENAHYNGILSCEFDPFKSSILATGGMDYSIKYWDTRKLSTPFATLTNNSHWIWDLKFNKIFSKVMIHSSSSSIVRGIISSFKDSEDVHSLHDEIDISQQTMIDYVEFEDSVYSLDWSLNDPWIFAAVSFNSFVHINSIPEDIRYKVILEN
jgi:EARP and GARP complex-interacting protein 1